MFFVSGRSLAQKPKCALLDSLGTSSLSATFERKRDVSIFRDGTTSISVAASKILVEKKTLSDCEILQFSLDYSDDKRIGVNDEISLSFESISNKFIYDAEIDRKLIFQADGKEIFVATLKQKFRDDISKGIKREHLSLEEKIDFPIVEKLAGAKNVTIELGKRTFSLTANQRRAIVDFYDELEKIVSKDKAVR